MHISHMRPSVPEQTLLQSLKTPPQAKAYDTLPVQAIPGGGDRGSRGARQQAPQRLSPRPASFDNSSASIRNFSSQLAALDLSSLGGDKALSAVSGEAESSGEGALTAGILDLLASAIHAPG